MKKTIRIFLLLLLLPVVLYLWGVFNNNRDLPMPDRSQLASHRESAINWLLQHKERILNDHNAMLWWMVNEAAKVSKDARLEMLVNEYKSRNRGLGYSIWAPLFWPQQRLNIDETSLYGLPDYNQHFIYSLHCADNLLVDLPVIAAQNRADFCFQPSHIYRPACVTHQLMGINFQRRQHCAPEAELQPVIASLQNDIVHQLTWDIRVIDVYLQRVMMLLITGADARVKPVWVQQILDHQLVDGGWGDFDPLIPLGSRSPGFSSRILSISRPRSSFHATAQGVYLLTLLENKQKHPH